MKKTILLLLVTSLCYSQFRFTRSLPDCFYKAVILCENENTSDISKNGWGCSAYNPYKENNISKFGEKSVGLNISGASYVDILYNAYYNPLAYGNDYTFEILVYHTSTSNSQSIVGSQSTVNDYCPLYFMQGANNITFANSATGSAWLILFASAANTVPINTWTHICQTRKGDKVYCFVNGKLLNTTTTINNLINNRQADNLPLKIGMTNNTRQFQGYVQNIKFSTIARYTSDFNPNKPY